MRALPWQLSFLQADPVRGEAGDPLLPGIKKKESEWVEFTQRQAAQEEGGLFPVLCGQQCGDDQATAESGSIRETGFGVPVDKGCAETLIIDSDPCTSPLFARVDRLEFSRRMQSGRMGNWSAPLLVSVHQEMESTPYWNEGKGAHDGE